MRAVKGSLGHSFKERCRELECARSTRALEDQPGYPVRKELGELGGTIIETWSLDARSEGSAGDFLERGCKKMSEES